jgi:hypothetical protein
MQLPGGSCWLRLQASSNGSHLAVRIMPWAVDEGATLAPVNSMVKARLKNRYLDLLPCRSAHGVQGGEPHPRPHLARP